MIQTIQQHITFNFGQDILNTHDNIIDLDDVIIIHIEAYISNNSTRSEDQTVTFQGAILEFSSAQEMIQLELVHPQLQVCGSTNCVLLQEHTLDIAFFFLFPAE